MNATERNHIERLRSMVLQRFTAETVSKWITEKTYLNGEKFSFEGHEYQDRILSDQSREIVIMKCSQVGLSELSVRLALALVNIMPNYAIGYVLPTSGFATTFAKTRFNPIVATCPEALSVLSKEVDSSEVKIFGSSVIYFRGSQVGNAAISVPLDHTIFDEVDFCDQEILSTYESRLTHSKIKRKHKLSTPTVPGFGIHKEFTNSRRHYNSIRCNHCNETFIPDYYRHVVVPGYDKHLDEIRAQHLPFIKWKEAHLVCPKCGKEPSLAPEYREWIIENNEEDHVAAGYAVQPFDAPATVTVPDLIKASTSYSRIQDFRNFSLGVTMEDEEMSFKKQELEALFVNGEAQGGVYVMGLDLGMNSHAMIGSVQHDGSIFVVHTEVIPVGALRHRVKELSRQWNLQVIVSDSLPYSETIIALQTELDHLFGAIFMKSKDVSLFNVRSVPREEKAGRELLRQVNINRDKALDSYMADIRRGMVGFKCTDRQTEIIEHHLDMRRVKVFDASHEVAYTWQKSKAGTDHWHFSGLYLYIAARLKGTAAVASPSSFQVRSLVLPAGNGWWAK